MRKSRSLLLSRSPTTTITPLLALLRTHCLRHAHRSTLVSGLLEANRRKQLQIERLSTDVQQLEQKIVMQARESEAEIYRQRDGLQEMQEKVRQLELERAELDHELVKMTPLMIATQLDGTLMKSDDMVNAVAVANGEDWLVAGTERGVEKWNIMNGSRLWETKCGRVNVICITADDELIVGGNESIFVWSAGDGSMQFEKETPQAFEIKFRPYHCLQMTSFSPVPLDSKSHCGQCLMDKRSRMDWFIAVGVRFVQQDSEGVALAVS